MTEPTKAAALDKLSKFRPHIGYPTKWRDYGKLTIDRGDLIGNVMRVASFELDRSLSKIGQPIDREEWLMTPQTVNAYYHPLKNEIVFPAAILQPPFFNADADDAVNYGGIGAVIGHEIGHGFDDQGSTCDGDGALRDWWTAEDRTAFEQRTAALIGQYDALEPKQAPGHHVNGSLTIGENIGDLGGLAIAYQAFQIAKQDGAETRAARRLHPGAAAVPQLGRGLADQGPHRDAAAADGHRPALARGVPVQPDRAQPGRVLRRVRGDRVRRAVAGRGPAGRDLVNLGWRVAPFGELVDRVAAAGPAGRPAVVAVNGHGSSGKTTLAGRLAATLPDAAVLHTDDLAWNHGVFSWDELLRDDVLPGGPGRGAAGLPAAAVAGPGPYGLDHPAGRARLPVRGGRRGQPGLASRRLRPGLLGGDRGADPLGARPGPAGRRRDVRRTASTSWMAEENAYTTRERPWEHADLLVYGGESIPYDRDARSCSGRRSDDLADLPGARHLGRVQPGVVTLIGCPLK